MNEIDQRSKNKRFENLCTKSENLKTSYLLRAVMSFFPSWSTVGLSIGFCPALCSSHWLTHRTRGRGRGAGVHKESEGEKKMKERKRGEESSKVFSYLKNFSSLSCSVSLSLVYSSRSLSLWCNSMCFTGPSWVGGLRWKTSEFLDVFLRERIGLKSFMCFEAVCVPCWTLHDTRARQFLSLTLSVW